MNKGRGTAPTETRWGQCPQLWLKKCALGNLRRECSFPGRCQPRADFSRNNEHQQRKTDVYVDHSGPDETKSGQSTFSTSFTQLFAPR